MLSLGNASKIMVHNLFLLALIMVFFHRKCASDITKYFLKGM